MLGSVSVVVAVLQAASGQLPERESVVLSQAQDPYRALALEVAAAESVAVVESLSEVAHLAPVHVLWVTAPASLSDEEMIRAGRFLEDHPDIAVGIITGSTAGQARALWLRASDAKGTRAAYAIAKHPRTGVGLPIGLVKDAPGKRSAHTLTKTSFSNALTEVDYLTFAGHGGPAYLGLPNESRFGAADVPSLPPIVIGTGSCNALRPWAPRSLALAFVDSGAAAYAGFTFSPIAGYLLGQYKDLSFRHTWPGFTVGEMIQLQNQGTLSAFATFPYYFLAGDPRLHLRDAAPYRFVSDRTSGDERILELEDVAAGVVPIRIPNGAGYGFAEVPGVGSAAVTDRFYNGRIQMMDWGEDKLLLVVQQAPALTVRLRRSAPWHRTITRPPTDALDHTFVYLPQTGGIPAPILGLAAWSMVLLWGHRARKGIVRPVLGRSFLAGGVLAAILGLYTLFRSGNVAVTSKVITPSMLEALDFFFLFSGAALLYALSRSWRGRTLAFLLGAFPALGPALFSFAGFTAINIRLASVLGAGLYTHHMGVLSSISFMLLVPPLFLAFRLAESRPSIRP
ncbi:MAG: hypothetical protein JSW71_15900 [Gemmatimonadota bacterium]|nr:MAG: hypothetical protein JSW71_15900 [Gemmatimonadota bacterium]